jgi:hypothetical protein
MPRIIQKLRHFSGGAGQGTKAAFVLAPSALSAAVTGRT